VLTGQPEAPRFARSLAGVSPAWNPQFHAASRRLRKTGRPQGLAPQLRSTLMALGGSTNSGVMEGRPAGRPLGVHRRCAGRPRGRIRDHPRERPRNFKSPRATGRLSQLVRLSLEQWSQPSTAEQLAQSVARAVIRRANIGFLQQVAPTKPALGPSTGRGHLRR
jgi:hypothetical protein